MNASREKKENGKKKTSKAFSYCRLFHENKYIYAVDIFRSILKRNIAVHELPYPYGIAWAQKNGEKHEKETSNRLWLSVRNFNCSKSESQMKTKAHKWKRLTKTLHFAQVQKRQVYFSRNSFFFVQR